MALPALSPADALEQARNRRAFKKGEFEYSLSEDGSPFAEGKNGRIYFPSGMPYDPVTNETVWVEG